MLYLRFKTPLQNITTKWSIFQNRHHVGHAMLLTCILQFELFVPLQRTLRQRDRSYRVLFSLHHAEIGWRMGPDKVRLRFLSVNDGIRPRVELWDAGCFF